jgi:glutathione peroxidase-family protein
LHKDDGLEILGFPSANFGGQEFADNKDIKAFTCSEKVSTLFIIHNSSSLHIL